MLIQFTFLILNFLLRKLIKRALNFLISLASSFNSRGKMRDLIRTDHSRICTLGAVFLLHGMKFNRYQKVTLKEFIYIYIYICSFLLHLVIFFSFNLGLLLLDVFLRM